MIKLPKKLKICHSIYKIKRYNIKNTGACGLFSAENKTLTVSAHCKNMYAFEL